MKLIIDIDEDYLEILKHEVQNGNDYKPFKLIANGIPLEEELEKIRDEVSWIAETTIDRNTGIAYCRKNVIYRIIDKHIAELEEGEEDV